MKIRQVHPTRENLLMSFEDNRRKKSANTTINLQRIFREFCPHFSPVPPTFCVPSHLLRYRAFRSVCSDRLGSKSK